MRGRLSEQNVEAAVLILPVTPLACEDDAIALQSESPRWEDDDVKDWNFGGSARALQ